VKLEHSYFTIFFNIADCVFLAPLQLHFGPIFYLLGALELSQYFRRVYIYLFLSPTNLSYILVKLEHFNFTIFFNIGDYVFWIPFSFMLDPFLTCQVCCSLVNTSEGYISNWFCLIPTYITYWRSWSTLTSLFSSILAIMSFGPPFSFMLGPFLTFQVSCSLVNTSEGYISNWFCLLPTYVTYWQSWSTLTLLFSSILSILCFWPLFSCFLSKFLTFEISWS